MPIEEEKNWREIKLKSVDCGVCFAVQIPEVRVQISTYKTNSSCPTTFIYGRRAPTNHPKWVLLPISGFCVKCVCQNGRIAASFIAFIEENQFIDFGKRHSIAVVGAEIVRVGGVQCILFYLQIWPRN